ncbi:Feruloyl CoA ortho-hydroxylase 1 [Striga hermonthica]|uniref:Feruloyl CoA ortho-hydroxylase 1 n=1 Tax=Striga hermonthica TaxID=68872 RepID=A0A9N7MZF2_STRHE|nr:Feruloyl CoA ortho-hydroxylase 1 [Striga hermonthica]
MFCYVNWTRLTIKKLLMIFMKGINIEEIDEDKERFLMEVLAASLVYYLRPELAVRSGRHRTCRPLLFSWDTLQILSNDKYQSIEHRVFLTGNMNRFFIPIFANALSDLILGPLPEVLGHGKKPKYKRNKHPLLLVTCINPPTLSYKRRVMDDKFECRLDPTAKSGLG